MKTLIVYHSFHHGNTAKIAKVLADELNAKMVKTEDEETNNWDEYELIGFGSGIYNGKHHKSILHAVEKLPAVKGKKAFVLLCSHKTKASDIIKLSDCTVTHIQCGNYEWD